MVEKHLQSWEITKNLVLFSMFINNYFKFNKMFTKVYKKKNLISTFLKIVCIFCNLKVQIYYNAK